MSYEDGCELIGNIHEVRGVVWVKADGTVLQVGALN